MGGEDQPRDDHGRFASTGGGDTGALGHGFRARTHKDDPMQSLGKIPGWGRKDFTPLQPVHESGVEWLKKKAAAGHDPWLEAAVQYRDDVYHAITVDSPHERRHENDTMIFKNGKPWAEGRMNDRGNLEGISAHKREASNDAIIRRLDRALEHASDRGRKVKGGSKSSVPIYTREFEMGLGRKKR